MLPSFSTGFEALNECLLQCRVCHPYSEPVDHVGYACKQPYHFRICLVKYGCLRIHRGLKAAANYRDWKLMMQTMFARKKYWRSHRCNWMVQHNFVHRWGQLGLPIKGHGQAAVQRTRKLKTWMNHVTLPIGTLWLWPRLNKQLI